MPAFLARHRAGLFLSAVFLVAWLLALWTTCADQPAPEAPERWVQGPPPIGDTLPAD